jgi:cephalosporin-C deacetylase
VVQFVGYDDGRGLPIDHLLWASAGYAHLVMDTRGQGGETPDRPAGPGGDIDGSPVVRGLGDASNYYYRRVFVDAVRAVEAVRTLPRVDAERVAVAGGSQGGGIALAVAALVPEVAAVMPDVPFPCHIARGVEIADSDPYNEVTRYLRIRRGVRERVLATLSYFDGVAFARRARARALFSVALQDLVSPPSTVYAAYNLYAGPKEIAVYPDNDHEGGGATHQARQLEWLRGVVGAGPVRPVA